MSKSDENNIFNIPDIFTKADLSEIDSLNDIRALIKKNNYFKNPDDFLELIKELFGISKNGERLATKTTEYKKLLLKYISNAYIIEDGRFTITNITKTLNGKQEDLEFIITRNTLGEGSFGIVREVKDHLGNSYALKISLETEENKLVDNLLEILFLMLLSAHEDTAIFFPQKIIPFIRSNNPNIDIEINQKPELLKNYKANLYVLQEKYDKTLGNYLLDKDRSLSDKLNVIAQVGFGLYISKKIFSFMHSDFKFNNIMIKLRNPEKKIITETIDEKTYELVIEEGKPLVKFIDLGMSSIKIDKKFLITNENPTDKDIIQLSKCEYRDLFYFIYTFYFIIEKNNNILEFFKFIIEKNNNVFKEAAKKISNINDIHFLNTVKNKTELNEVTKEIKEYISVNEYLENSEIYYIFYELLKLCKIQEINENIIETPLIPRNFIKAILEYAESKSKSKSLNLNLKEIKEIN